MTQTLLASCVELTPLEPWGGARYRVLADAFWRRQFLELDREGARRDLALAGAYGGPTEGRWTL